MRCRHCKKELRTEFQMRQRECVKCHRRRVAEQTKGFFEAIRKIKEA